MKIVSLTISCVLVWFSGCSSIGEQNERTFQEELDKITQESIDYYGGKGISLAVMFPDGSKYSSVGGYSHDAQLIDTSTLFAAGSITKTFTTISIMKLVEQNLLSLEDPIGKWYPDIEHIDSSITIRQILNHTSGIYDLPDNQNLYIDIVLDQNSMWQMENTITKYIKEPNFEPGGGWQYSSTGFLLLRDLIPNLTGVDLHDQYEIDIFAIAGLDNTCLYPFEPLSTNFAHGWLDSDSDGLYEPMGDTPWSSFHSMAGGGIFTTPLELVEFSNALFHTKILVSDSSLAEMLSMDFVGGYEGFVWACGLGCYQWVPELVNGYVAYGHGGDAYGYAAGMFYFQDSGISIAIMCNTDDGRGMYVLADLIDLAMDKYENGD